MKIKIGTGHDSEWTEINVGSHEVLIQEAFVGVGIETDWGLFGIAARDGVIEVMFDGKLVIDADLMKAAIDKAVLAIEEKLERPDYCSWKRFH
jgi:hypothetical protein